ncbi:MAG TPA: hypothetical protein VN231_07755 [Allosphingosinicella sp.]|nr:hypothetical protein [Allosphingosinicella sp.]
MRALFPIALLLAGCGTGAGTGNSDGAGNGADEAVRAAVQTATLTGLYEGGAGPRRNQLCIVDRAAGDARFGLVLWGRSDSSCSGAGAAVREGALLRLAMEGDGSCEVAAAIEGGRVVFPAVVPAGCSYYCGGGATLAGAAFDKVGGTAEDALRASDLVGDPLCG